MKAIMTTEPQSSLASRLGWLVLIWAASVATIGAVAYLLRWWLLG